MIYVFSGFRALKYHIYSRHIYTVGTLEDTLHSYEILYLKVFIPFVDTNHSYF